MQYPGRFTLKVLITGFNQKKKKKVHIWILLTFCVLDLLISKQLVSPKSNRRTQIDTPKGRAGHFGDVNASTALV